MADTRSNRRSWNDPQLDDARVGVQVTGFWRPWQPTDSCSVAALDGHMYFNDQSAPERSSTVAATSVSTHSATLGRQVRPTDTGAAQ